MQINESIKIKKVAFYIRVSTEDQVERYGLDSQISSLINLVKAKSYGDIRLEYAGGLDKEGNIIDKSYIYSDKDISGTLPIDERPEFVRLKEDIEFNRNVRRIDVIAVFKIDRLARKLKILLDVVEFFEKNDIEFISAHESIDTSTPFGKAILGMVGVLAELELNNIIIRTSGGKLIAKKNGVYSSKHVPFGYKKDENKRLFVEEREAPYVKEIFSRYILGDSQRKIAIWLENNNVLSPSASSRVFKKTNIRTRNKRSDNYWEISTITSILKNEIYIGDYYYNNPKDKAKRILSEYHHEPIISKSDFTKVQVMLKDNENRGMQSDHIYILRGLLKCASCYNPEYDEAPHTWVGDRKAYSNGEKKEFAYSYKCKRKQERDLSLRCTTLPFPAEEIEEYVINFVKNLLSDPEPIFKEKNELESTKLAFSRIQTRKVAISKALNGILDEVERLREQHRHGVISISQLESDLLELEKRKLRLETENEELDANIGESELESTYFDLFKRFQEIYPTGLDKLFEDRKETQLLLQLLISEIIVFSRPVKKNDVIAGRKSENQMIPYALKIFLRLPDQIFLDYLNKFIERHYPEYRDGKFEVKGFQWWTTQGSNL